MTQPQDKSDGLSIPRGAALYVGALLGPGLLLLPGLAASIAGPASMIAWLGLLVVSGLLAVVFSALGVRFPSRGGVATYTSAGLGASAGTVTGWCFVGGVVFGAPVVCLIGGAYVADLSGGRPHASSGIAAGLLVGVLALALAGVRTTSAVQLGLVAVLVVLMCVAVGGSAPSARTSNWHPFAPHGGFAIVRAASVLMLSFVGWEAIASLTSRFSNPRRQLPRVIAIAFVTTSALYLSLAISTIAVLGNGAASNVPLADLLQVSVGHVGRYLATAAAVVLTVGTTNAYLSGAATMARTLTATERNAHQAGSPRALLGAIAGMGMVIIGLESINVLSTAQLVTIPTALFLAVYLGCTGSAVRSLNGGARVAACLALVAVVTVLAFTGWGLAVTGAVVLSSAAASHGRPQRDESRQ